ncbi:M6 family metalloprotease domain containing protein [Nitzschia inconspicua]|uniref:M6 family metalloprotease domain containing protein n=1 Tax=Nitzschia inconspicua TaxID=303405 RepID=A0A9K3KNW1_9STRA|nr:M6 family metalloprotease domain containing protein [Nitzschia inconspicua]
MKLTIIFIISFAFGFLKSTQAGPACPFPVQFEQDGTNSTNVKIFFHGSSPDQSFLSDSEGYTVIEDKVSEQFVYAIQNQTSGELVSSGIVVGNVDPAAAGIPKGLVPFKNQPKTRRQLFEEAAPVWESPPRDRRLSLPSVMKNLVVLVRFSDHAGRRLPSQNDFNILFNRVDSNHALAPTGSVRDVFRFNSYGKFTLQSSIYGWINLPRTESYYANGVSGFGSSRYIEALHFAMNSLRDNYRINFSNFDANNDGKVDMVTMIHSGYAAEIFGTDQYGTSVNNRIWSHHWRLPSSSMWVHNGVVVHQYSTSPALFGLSGSEIGRIGVISHEIGHAINLPDLYGTYQGNGIGSYDLMSNHWGFAPSYSQSQLYPPIMSPWTKMTVGWLDPILIVKSGTFNIAPSAVSGQVYRIDLNTEGSEYLLIENRQPIKFDIYLPTAGLAIWRIDETAMNVEGFPGQQGNWPFNGKHYKVALLQADGEYHLERRINHGDRGDLFHANGMDWIGPSLELLDGPFPNTDRYSGFPRQLPQQTGIRIRDISPSRWSMEFKVDFLQRLSTTFIGGNGAAGNMFDVFAKKTIVLRLLYLHLNVQGPVSVEVWTRTGTHVSFESKPWLWQRRVVVSVDGRGRGKKTMLDVGGIQLNANTRYSFYIMILNGRMRYTNGNRVGRAVNENSDCIVYEGVGLSVPFHNVFSPRIWNGDLHYDVISSGRGSRRLATHFDGGSGQDGVMFDIIPYTDLNITAFDLHIFDSSEVMVRIFAKNGSFVGSEKNCNHWKLIEETIVAGQGMNIATKVELPDNAPVPLKHQEMHSFYISIINGTGLGNSLGEGSGTIAAQNEHMAIVEGVGVASLCGSTFHDRVFNGAIHYSLVN